MNNGYGNNAEAPKVGHPVLEIPIKLGKEVEMSIFKRGRIYWYKFNFNGEAIRESTRQTNQHTARQMESAHRTSLAKGEVGIRDKKIAPTLKSFCIERVQPWAKSTFEKASPKTWRWYGFGIDSIKKSKTLANFKVDEIGPELVAEYASERQRDGLQISSVNSCLRALRRVLRLAVEWGVLETSPKVKFLGGEHRRERVITSKEEAQYLAVALPLLHDVSLVLFDTGMRPEECHCLRWENVTWEGGRNGVLLITKGKTKAARRVLPLSPRVRITLENRWKLAGEPSEGWVWPAQTKDGHINHDSVKLQHKKALKLAQVRPFEVYSIRHTFLTRLGESGCDAWTLARIAGHSNINISQRYVHPSEDAVLNALSRLSGHNSGHSAGNATLEQSDELSLNTANRES
jgi:integrase